VNSQLNKMRRTFAAVVFAVIVCGGLRQQILAAPPQKAVPTKTSELTKSRDALYDAYDRWLKQDLRLDQLLQASPVEARKRLDDAQKANQDLHQKKEQYHAQLRSEYERMKTALGSGNGDLSPDAIASLQESYDAVLGVLSEDANNIESQMPTNAADGPSLILRQGLEQTKRSIKDLQLTMIDQKNHAKKLLESGEDARKAREAVTGHVDELLSSLAKYEALDGKIARDMDDRIAAYRNIVAQNADSCADQNCGAKSEQPPRMPAVPGKQMRENPTQADNAPVKKDEALPALSLFAGHWRYVNTTELAQKKGSYPVKSCDVQIVPDGQGSLRCDFDGVPASARSDVAFHFKLAPANAAASALVGDWTEGTAAGSVNFSRRDADKLDVTWKLRKGQQEFFIVVLYSPITLSKVQ